MGSAFRKGQEDRASREQQQFENKVKLQQLANEARRIAETERSNRATEVDRDEDLAFRKTVESNDQTKERNRLAFDEKKLLSEETRAANELKERMRYQSEMLRIRGLELENTKEYNRIRGEALMIQAGAAQTRAENAGGGKLKDVPALVGSDHQALLRQMSQLNFAVRQTKQGTFQMPSDPEAIQFYDDVRRLASVMMSTARLEGRPINKVDILSQAAQSVYDEGLNEGVIKPPTQLGEWTGFGSTSYGGTPSSVRTVFDKHGIVPSTGGLLPDAMNPTLYEGKNQQMILLANNLKKQGKLNAATIKALEEEFGQPLPQAYK